MKRYRIIKNKLDKYIPQLLDPVSLEWQTIFTFGKSEFDTFEAAENEIKRRQYEVVATYD